MTYITASLTVIVTLLLAATTSGYYGQHVEEDTYVKAYTRTVTIRQGKLQGLVVTWKSNNKLQPVEQYLGIPYAAAPVGDLRYMPPGNPPPWITLMMADTFGPVCPQKFPNITAMGPQKRDEFLRLKDYLNNQSEDCLYLNIYAPHQGNARSTRKYPVMVYIHGESFEWNSGNPYDGSVLAAYGNVIVVTLNYRLGVLGFLKAGTEQDGKSNFGLVDQIAALLWVKQNIEAFGGDPNIVTLFGHGTGAACASLLMLSHMTEHEGETLFQRAILMSGSALSDWALSTNPRDVTYQVAQALNCQIHDDFAGCLRKRKFEQILEAFAVTSPYKPRFGPIVDSLAVPNDPKKLMTIYSSMFKRFELLYGVTEMESIHLLNAEAQESGLLEKELDRELEIYLDSRCERKPDRCVTLTLGEYKNSDDYELVHDEMYGDYIGEEPDSASINRNILLDVLSDARTVAPVVQMGKYHAALNPQSYFYVFTHKTQSKKHIRNKSYNGEELPYVFGVPLGGPKFHFVDQYTEKEKQFSEITMTYFCNFAYTGDPNMPRKNEYITMSENVWPNLVLNWPEYDLKQQRYMQLDLHPKISSGYRDRKMTFWNDEFLNISLNPIYIPAPKKPHPPMSTPTKSIPPWIALDPKYPLNVNKYENFNKPLKNPNIGIVHYEGTRIPDNIMNQDQFGTLIKSPSDQTDKGLAATITLALGSVFILTNIFILLAFYLRKYRKKKVRSMPVRMDELPGDDPEAKNDYDDDGCNFMQIVRKSSRSEDTYEAVKPSSSKDKLKLPRQMSTSTIDAHTKVRDWITNEIIYKYSPRFLRRPRNNIEIHEKVHREAAAPLNDNNSTLGRSPTRPVSPSDDKLQKIRPPLVKSTSNPVQKGKPGKVSVSVDATPAGRGNSVLQQQPIELTKSLDRPNFEGLRRSLTLEDFSAIKSDDRREMRKSTTNINLKYPLEESTVIRIEHNHSRSDPVQDLYSRSKKLRTFDPTNCDVNVTSRDDNQQRVAPLTPEEALMTIKRRNFPKVLPDYPSREALAKKRRSMPVPMMAKGLLSQDFGKMKFAPEPPPRTTSTLTRRVQNHPPVCQSAPMLAEEPPSLSPEPELNYNNLYFGPLIPKKTELSSSESSKLNTQPIYDCLKERKVRPVAKTVVTTDPNQPVKKAEPKVIIKPTMSRSGSDGKKSNIPRVVVHDNIPEGHVAPKGDDDKNKRPSQIPTLLKTSKESSSSESSPSEESDTGTVVKRI